jgi:hypothetical protein
MSEDNSIGLYEYMSAILILGSIQTIGVSSAVIAYYNTNEIEKDAKFTLNVIAMVLACVGVIIGLYAFMYPDMFKNMYYIGIVLIWLAVTFTIEFIGRTVITNQDVGFYISIGITVVLTLAVPMAYLYSNNDTA